jgi:capsular polysaccharide biosynthesis protein
VDVDAEQEVDFGRYWRAIAARWWLPVGGLVVGLVIGYLVSLGTHSSTYKATALVYLGQPLAPNGAATVSSAPTTLGLVSNLVTSASVTRQVGLKRSKLARNITTKPVLGITAAKVGTPAPLIAITVSGSPPKKVAAAANALAHVAVGSQQGYTNTKIEKLEEQIAFDNRSITRNNARFALAQRQQQSILNDKSLDPTERLLLLSNINTTLVTVEQRLGQLETDRLNAQQFLSLAQNVEQPQVRSPAVATKTAGANSRTGAAVGGLIGLIVGILAALLWDPIASRRTEA